MTSCLSQVKKKSNTEFPLQNGTLLQRGIRYTHFRQELKDLIRIFSITLHSPHNSHAQKRMCQRVYFYLSITQSQKSHLIQYLRFVS
jgi:hypothetical protein